ADLAGARRRLGTVVAVVAAAPPKPASSRPNRRSRPLAHGVQVSAVAVQYRPGLGDCGGQQSEFERMNLLRVADGRRQHSEEIVAEQCQSLVNDDRMPGDLAVHLELENVITA